MKEINQRQKSGENENPKQMLPIVIRDNGNERDPLWLQCATLFAFFWRYSPPPQRACLLSKLIQMPERNTNN